MTSDIRTIYIRFILLFALIAQTLVNNSYGQSANKEGNVFLKIDGSKRLQQIDGIGVNTNTSSWNGRELELALSLLLDSMHATIWRVIVETVEKWEEVNDNDDPFTFNWDYYHRLYETPKFIKAWEMIAWLNSRGITDKLMINIMGSVPIWMGGERVNPEYEDEYIEMLVSFFYYARNVKHLQFGLISPMNEPDIRKEGPTVGPEQFVRLLKKFIKRMKDAGIGDIQFVAPDVASMTTGVKKYLPELLKDSLIMSKTAHWGLHSYGGYYAEVDSLIKASSYPKSDFWITEWNAWCNGCDDGILGEFNYNFGAKSVGYLLDLLKHGATACLVWEGYDSYYEHHAPSPFSYWGVLGYNPTTKVYSPRKHFYTIQHVSKFLSPGSWQLDVTGQGDSVIALSFYDTSSHRVSIVGINNRNKPIRLNGTLINLPTINHLEVYYTNEVENLHRNADISAAGNSFTTSLPPNCIFTLTGTTIPASPLPPEAKFLEPQNWYAGDIHVHRNCGDDSVLSENKLRQMMDPNNLAVVSVLADMGNGEVKYAIQDIQKITGADAPQSEPNRIIHWDAEWHWDATYSQFTNQALGGHLVLLGLKHTKQIWAESPYKILEWAHKQKAIGGFAHFQYLNDTIQNELNCCIPVDYPVEAALGTIDFVSEDVFGSISSNNGNYNSEAVINAYYKLLNCGFRPGFAAGTDYPCNADEPLGTLLTYVNVKGKLTYRKWIEGIKKGRTVVSRNGHEEFLELKINNKYLPGDEIKMKSKDSVVAVVKWTAAKELKGKIELVCNGKVISTYPGAVKPGETLSLTTTIPFNKSGWVCARRMDERGHQTHTAPVYISINKQPVRVSAKDAEFFIAWIDNILENIKPGGKWNKYFPKDLATVEQRYLKAKSVYENILRECIINK